MEYKDFIAQKVKDRSLIGFDPVWMPDFLFDFQSHLTEWSIQQGRSALLADCGLGKTIMQLVWAENIIRSHRGRTTGLILTPLTVAKQTIAEGEKFGIEVHNARNKGLRRNCINITNYENLHKFNPSDLLWVVCDESSILKNYAGERRRQITEFLKGIRFRLLCSATPCPNDYTELGTSSEALGIMPRMQMLGRFFSHNGENTQDWELKGHSKTAYWRWVSSWARSIRKPSDFGFDDANFILPPKEVFTHVIRSARKGKGFFNWAVTREDQLEEKRNTVQSRCEKVASLIPKDRPSVTWCHLNPEGDLLTKLIPGAVQVAGKDSDDSKESKLEAFTNGEIQHLVTKPKIAGFGMNWQHCSDVFCFPSHSYEQYYQLVCRFHRFGQKSKVNVNVVMTEAQRMEADNMFRKEKQARDMFDSIIREMSGFQTENKAITTHSVKVPQWL